VNSKVLVTGSGGLLGAELVKELVNAGYEVIALYRKHKPPELKGVKPVRLDITSGKGIKELMIKERPEAVVHAAAMTDVDGCERDKPSAWRVNVEGTEAVAKASKSINAYLVFISSDYVFNGSKGLYAEGDIPDPINYYGLTKLVAEFIVKEGSIDYLIVRPSVIYGLGGSKLSFAEFVANSLSEGKEIKALTDQYVSPTYNKLLAESILEILNLRPSGILHVAGPRLSRYEFALRIAEALKLPKELVKKGSMKDMSSWIARRPKDSSLNTDKARKILRTEFFNLDKALNDFRNEWIA
jgi:dTDP-4-dehydrorhamnose reductase